MFRFNALVCFALCSGMEARIITIEDFGGKPDSQIPSPKEPILHSEFHHSSVKNVDKLRVKHHKAKDDENIKKQAIENTKAYNLAMQAAERGDKILLKEHETYTFIGGIEGVNLNGVTLDFAGYTRFIFDLDQWPMRNYTGGAQDVTDLEYVPCIDLVDCTDLVITCSAQDKAIVDVDYETDEIYLDQDSGNGGIIDGRGKKWWDSAIIGDIDVENRPRLIDIRGSMNVTVEHLTLVNSPYWSLTLEAIGAEVHHVNVLIDRKYQRRIHNNTELSHHFVGTGDVDSETRIERRLRSRELKFHFPDVFPDWVLQPQNLNTDGIDPIGQDIYVHDCIILNDDDSIAVKPPRHGKRGSILNGTIPYDCTRNVTVEDVVLTGFGASIGSVGPSPTREYHPCVDQVSFRRIKMPGTGKGIYIKSNKSDCNNGVGSSITNILYDDIYIKSPVWWPIWIGPQQQHEPHSSLGGNCDLDYPIGTVKCPTQGCTNFENITIRNVLIEDPLLSPGVLMGNASSPMKNILFDNVTMNIPFKYYLTHGRLPFHTRRFPFKGRYKVKGVKGVARNCNPIPDGFDVIE